MREVEGATVCVGVWVGVCVRVDGVTYVCG